MTRKSRKAVSKPGQIRPKSSRFYASGKRTRPRFFSELRPIPAISDARSMSTPQS
jgi:hypothetical protein